MGLAQKVAPYLWSDDQGEEAAGFYTAIFSNSRIVAVTRQSDTGREIHGREPGSVMTVEFELDGQSCTVGESGGGSFQPYDTLMAESVPALREAGPSEAEVRRLIEENPRDAFAVRVRPAP